MQLKTTGVCFLIGLAAGFGGHLSAAELPGNLVALLDKEAALAGGQEREGNAYAAGYERQTRDERGLTILHWLSPGQEAIYRVASSPAAAESYGP